MRLDCENENVIDPRLLIRENILNQGVMVHCHNECFISCVLPSDLSSMFTQNFLELSSDAFHLAAFCDRHSRRYETDYFMELTCNWLWEEPTGVHSGFKAVFFCCLFFSNCGLSSCLLPPTTQI